MVWRVLGVDGCRGRRAGRTNQTQQDAYRRLPFTRETRTAPSRETEGRGTGAGLGGAPGGDGGVVLGDGSAGRATP